MTDTDALRIADGYTAMPYGDGYIIHHESGGAEPANLGMVAAIREIARLRAALAQPAAPDRWNEGFKHGQWLAKHSAPVVECADSATPFVERSAGNVSDNAAPVAPARWYCVTNYGGATLCTGRDDAAEVAAEQDIAIPRHGPHRAVMLAEVRPARVPLTDAQIDALFDADPPGASRAAQRRVARAVLAAAATPAQGEPK